MCEHEYVEYGTFVADHDTEQGFKFIPLQKNEEPGQQHLPVLRCLACGATKVGIGNWKRR